MDARRKMTRSIDLLTQALSLVINLTNKNMKKILLSLGALAAVMIALPMFSAFEAHVINVTAQIENDLSVPLKSINFGTVFPQEHLDKPLGIRLSDSFIAEGRVDDVEYIIRQKPKCGVTTNNGTVLVGPTATGHVIPTIDNPLTPEDESKGGTAYTINCGSAPADMPTQGTWGVLPSLCEYISKNGRDEDGLETNNDDVTPSFHKPFTVSSSIVSWLDTRGRLTKGGQDVQDDWIIDLAVPCFGGYCAQDWENFVLGINPNAVAADYVQSIDNEHKVFGCDLWVEVESVSTAPYED